jgi:hypothetical protein
MLKPLLNFWVTIIYLGWQRIELVWMFCDK